MSSIAITIASAACNAPVPSPPTGGVDVPGGTCGRGVVVVSSDYQSTNVSLVGHDGALLSPSLISSASASTALSAPLSGDVVTTNVRGRGDEIVLIDRYPASVLTWIDVATGDVRAQLDVSTGFAANPRDYLEIDDTRAYVSRFETNPDPGATAHDAGGDLLVVDPRGPAIVDRIDLSPAMQDSPGFLPRASRMVQVGDDVYVLLLAYNADFSDAAPSRLVRIDASGKLADTIVLDDVFGCEGLTATADRLVVTCSGLLSGGATDDPVGSALIFVDVESGQQQMVHAVDLLGQPLGFGAAPTDTGVLVNALGAFDLTGGDDAVDAILHVTSDGSFTTILTSQSRPFELGDVKCTRSPDHAPGATMDDDCGRCFVTDGETGVLHELDIADGSLVGEHTLDDGIGLPPRTLGLF